jgi:hypothetical protein
MILSQGSLENPYRLTLLRGADLAVDLHRRLARRMTQQLLSDPRIDARSDQPARRSISAHTTTSPASRELSVARLPPSARLGCNNDLPAGAFEAIDPWA